MGWRDAPPVDVSAGEIAAMVRNPGAGLSPQFMAGVRQYMADHKPAWQEAPKVEETSPWASAGRGALQGVSFGFADEIGAILKNAFGGQNFDEALENAREWYRKGQKAHPFAYGVGEVGGVLPWAAVPGASALRAATIPGKIVREAGTGATVGALHGAGTAEGDIADRAQGALEGGIVGVGTGALAVPAARAIGAGTRAISSAVKGDPTVAAQKFMDAALLDRFDPGRVKAMAPEAMALDAGQAMQGLAEGVSQSTQARNILRDALEARAINAEVLRRQAANDAATMFGSAVRNADPVDTKWVLDVLDQKIADVTDDARRRQLVNLRQRILAQGDVAERLSEVQSDLGKEIMSLRRSDSYFAGQMAEVRNALVDELDTATRGRYRPAQKHYQELLTRAEMLETDAATRNLGRVVSRETKKEAKRSVVPRTAREAASIVGAPSIAGAIVGGNAGATSGVLTGLGLLGAQLVGRAGRAGAQALRNQSTKKTNARIAEMLTMGPADADALEAALMRGRYGRVIDDPTTEQMIRALMTGTGATQGPKALEFGRQMFAQ